MFHERVLRIGRLAVIGSLMLLAAVRAGEEKAGGPANEKTGEKTSEKTVEKAEETGAEDVPAGHSYHGEVFNEGPRQKAYLMGNTGKVDFPVTTRSDPAQKFFHQGVGQLHGFWYFEAERSFRQVAALDPDCAMAYWGMAMANIENEKRARGFIEEAVKRREGAGHCERMWIDGLADYLKEDPPAKKKRRQAYIRSLESIIHDFPENIEARAFLAVRLWQFKGDLPIVSHESVNALISDILAVEPMHPAHHYKIHLWDKEKPERALPSAARCGQSASTIAHMWHMPGHIYSRLHRYADACWQQEASARVDHVQMIRDRLLPDQIHNFAHNNEWLIRNLVHVGRVRDAIDLAKNMIELPRHPRYNTYARRGRSASYGRARLFEVLERYELWEELVALSETVYLEPTDLPREQERRLRALGTAFFARGDLERLEESIAALEERRASEEEAREAAGREAEEKAREDEKSDEEIEKARKQATQKLAGRVKDLEERIAHLGVYRELLGGHCEAPAEKIDSLKGVSKVWRSRLHLEWGDREKAETLVREAVDAGEGEVVPLAHLVDLLHRTGKKEEAAEAFEKLRPISAWLDTDVPAFQRLAPIAAELGLPADWRPQPTVPDDVGERPDLDSLGPFRWTPPSAPEWSLPAGDGTIYTMRQYRGRPVVVIFYLGHGCLHCVEQLEVFAPATGRFDELGISLIAISTDTLEDLRSSLEIFETDGEFPFPLVSDSGMAIFREYRAFDDFEKLPLHGTFLVDADGKVRWQDISYEPFTDTEFLLKEARRLLAQKRPAWLTRKIRRF